MTALGKVWLGLSMSLATSFTAVAQAQTVQPTTSPETGGGSTQADARGASSEQGADSPVFLEEITVTAQKKNVAENVQDVAIAMTALGPAQLEALNYRTLTDVSVVSPNVTLDSNGNSRASANFTVRGIGSTSSIATIEPAVGVFVNGIYQGIPLGLVADSYDLASVEILRGPQGTLFGRNVTGGAILLNTRRPSGQTGGEIRASLETGPEYSLSGAFETSLAPDVVDVRLAAHYRNDEGWFTNNFDGSELGKEKVILLRPTAVFHVSDRVEQTFIGEYGRIRGDGPASQGQNLNGVGNGFQINIDRPGFNNSEWASLVSETSIQVGFGNGVITNLFGYRSLNNDSSADLDASPFPSTQLNSYTKQEQYSNELRYAGRFGDFNITVGGFFFTQDIFIAEDFNPFTLGAQGGGGKQDHESYGLFAQGTIDITPNVRFVSGLRYSYEKKHAVIIRRQPGGCVAASRFCNFPLAFINDSDDWRGWTPKFALEFRPAEDTLFYASYAQGIRSGGYNLRLSAAADPGHYDQERVTTYEAGMKADFLDRRLRVNVALFKNRFSDLQRTVNFEDRGRIIQILTNAADAKSLGFEGDVVFVPIRNVEIMGNVGFVDMDYTKVFFDLSGDGRIDGKDLALKVTRLSRWSYGAGIVGRHDLSFGGSLNWQVRYSYRDRQAAQDSNMQFFRRRNELNGNISYLLPGGNLELSVYARNLLNEVPDTGAKNLSAASPVGGLISIGEGRSVGLSMRYKF